MSVALPEIQVLDLPSGPSAVRTARHWVCRVLHAFGRDDLADSAALAVSELVTNALIHGEPPVAVRMRTARPDTTPRIEVLDHSPASPRPHPLEFTTDDDLLTTVGRGLALVGMHSQAWGSESVNGGKVVWFEPRPEPAAGEIDLDLFDIAEPDPRPMITLRLRTLPMADFTRVRTRYLDLRREVQLVALSHPEDQTLTYFAAVMTEIDRVRAHGDIARAVRQAAEAGAERVDLEVLVPAESAVYMAQLRVLLAGAAVDLERAGLLTSPPTGHDRDLLMWYLGEFVRQARGDAPLPAPESD